MLAAVVVRGDEGGEAEWAGKGVEAGKARRARMGGAEDGKEEEGAWGCHWWSEYGMIGCVDGSRCQRLGGRWLRAWRLQLEYISDVTLHKSRNEAYL